MLRIYKEYLGAALACMAYTTYLRGLPLSRVIDTATKEITARGEGVGASKEVKTALGRVYQSARNNGTPDNSMESIAKMLLEDDGPNSKQEQDLLDEIVSIVGLPFTRNILGGGTIRDLREALLLPSEIAGTVARMREKALHCSHCGIELADGEMVSFRSNDGVNRGKNPMITCAACHIPSKIRRAGDAMGGTNNIDSRMAKSILRLTQKKPTPEEIEREQARDRGNTPLTMRTTGNRWRTFGGDRPVEPPPPIQPEPNNPIFANWGGNTTANITIDTDGVLRHTGRTLDEPAPPPRLEGDWVDEDDIEEDD